MPTISARAHAAATAVGFSRLALHVRLGTYTYYGVAYFGYAYCCYSYLNMALLTVAMPTMAMLTTHYSPLTTY